MKGHSVTRDTAGSDQSVPRHGSIYERLDKARAQRLQSLSPQIAANDTPHPINASNRRQSPSKMHLLPTLKTQEAFDLPKHSSRIPGIAKAGIAVLAVSVLAGILLFERGTNAPQSGIAAPVGLPSASPQVSLPVADEPARVSASEQIKDATIETLPVIPTPPGDGMPVEVQHVTAPLTAPEPSPSDRAKDP